ncbi:hypothetical protein D0T50_12280 [Bacteroides sp. 214]|uniref:hypothetical protein n=1 Tax=Bacteroides sp. 214 TaxID=2302935 RepID=UPI0013D80516|nr:hypothetical protein [Bacteroides sp. 214]NDW13661.1 hypothetical protein [Bacteroides sp. 214]
MKPNFLIILLLTAGLMMLYACDAKKKPVSPSEETDTNEQINDLPEEQLVANEALNDAAYFVAGLPVTNTRSKLYGLSQTSEWKAHARNMDQIWNSFQQNAPKILSFTQTELEDINKQCKTLFYPFGGPDFLFSNAFFPQVDTYFLIGLERTGQAIRVKHPSAKTYRLYQDAVSDVLSLSFFQTRDMNVEEENDTIDGVIPIISMLMARTDKEIISIENVRIDENGTIVTSNGEQTGLVEMKFFRKGTSKLQRLYYYATDLSNDGLNSNQPLLKYIRKLDKNTTATFVKSASYLMHEPSFSMVRDLILSSSKAVLQDDSSVPFAAFQPNLWNITLYGTFYKPVAAYAQYPQLELRDAYQLGEPKPLNFRIGYSRQSNLLLARRR